MSVRSELSDIRDLPQDKQEEAYSQIYRKYKFDPEANKDLETKDPRGIEAHLDYVSRRDKGYQPVNQKDDPNSRFSLDAIENGFLADQVKSGLEFAVTWDANNELMSIQKGKRDSVALYSSNELGTGIPRTRGGTFTHTHPSETNKMDYDFDFRSYGLPLSDGDFKTMGNFQYRELRAVAREGIYSVVADPDNVKFSKDWIDTIKKDSVLSKAFESGDKWYKQGLALKLISSLFRQNYEKINEFCRRTPIYSNPENPLDRKPIDKTLPIDRRKDGGYTNSEAYAVLLSARQKELVESFGFKWTFTPNKGYEGIAKGISVVSAIGSKSKEAVKTVRQMSNAGELRRNGTDAPFKTPSEKNPFDRNGNLLPNKTK
jgi:hypothetical protein